MKIIFITEYMKFRKLQLTIFRNLLQTQRFGVTNNIRGRPKIKDLCNVFKSVIFKVKSRGQLGEDTALARIATAVTRYPQSINTSHSGVRIICLMKYTAVVYVYIRNTNEYAGNISLLILRLSKLIEVERRLDQIQPIAGGMGQKSIH